MFQGLNPCLNSWIPVDVGSKINMCQDSNAGKFRICWVNRLVSLENWLVSGVSKSNKSNIGCKSDVRNKLVCLCVDSKDGNVHQQQKVITFSEILHDAIQVLDDSFFFFL